MVRCTACQLWLEDQTTLQTHYQINFHLYHLESGGLTPVGRADAASSQIGEHLPPAPAAESAALFQQAQHPAELLGEVQLAEGQRDHAAPSDTNNFTDTEGGQYYSYEPVEDFTCDEFDREVLALIPVEDGGAEPMDLNGPLAFSLFKPNSTLDLKNLIARL
jgi:hypothetical protein